MRILPVGRTAVLVEVDSAEHAMGLASWAQDRNLARDVVPGAESVLLDGLGEQRDRAALADVLASWVPTAVDPGPKVEIVMTYDGPDLDDVAEHWGCGVADVVARHRATEFVSAFCGFAPGFAYLSGLSDDLPDVPRLATPRTRVPAGSVGIAGRWCGVYPTDSPGGWRLIGRTDADLWNTARHRPALLAPGTRVRFRDASDPG